MYRHGEASSSVRREAAHCIANGNEWRHIQTSPTQRMHRFYRVSGPFAWVPVSFLLLNMICLGTHATIIRGKKHLPHPLLIERSCSLAWHSNCWSKLFVRAPVLAVSQYTCRYTPIMSLNRFGETCVLHSCHCSIRLNQSCAYTWASHLKI